MPLNLRPVGAAMVGAAPPILRVDGPTMASTPMVKPSAPPKVPPSAPKKRKPTDPTGEEGAAKKTAASPRRSAASPRKAQAKKLPSPEEVRKALKERTGIVERRKWSSPDGYWHAVVTLPWPPAHDMEDATNKTRLSIVIAINKHFNGCVGVDHDPPSQITFFEAMHPSLLRGQVRKYDHGLFKDKNGNTVFILYNPASRRDEFGAGSFFGEKEFIVRMPSRFPRERAGDVVGITNDWARQRDFDLADVEVSMVYVPPLGDD